MKLLEWRRLAILIMAVNGIRKQWHGSTCVQKDTNTYLVTNAYPESDFCLFSIATWGSCFSDEMVLVFCRLSQLCKSSNHPVVWVFKLSFSFFLVRKPNFGFVTAGSNWSNLAAIVGGCKVNEEDLERSINSVWGFIHVIPDIAPIGSCIWSSVSSVGDRYPMTQLIEGNISESDYCSIKLFPFDPIRRSWTNTASDPTPKTGRWNSGYNLAGGRGKGSCDGRRAWGKREQKKKGQMGKEKHSNIRKWGQ